MVGGAYGALDEFKHILKTRDLIRPPFGAARDRPRPPALVRRGADEDHRRRGRAAALGGHADGVLPRARRGRPAVHVARRPVRRHRRARGLLAGVAGDAGVDLPLLRLDRRDEGREDRAHAARHGHRLEPLQHGEHRLVPTASSAAASSASRARCCSRAHDREPGGEALLQERRRRPGLHGPDRARRDRGRAGEPRGAQAPTRRRRRAAPAARRARRPGAGRSPAAASRRRGGAAGRPRRPASASSASRAQRMPNATPSRTDPSSAARSVARLRPVHAPRAPGSRSGVRSPVRCGTNSGPPARASPSSPRTRRAQSSARPAFWTAASAYQPSPAARNRWHVGASTAGSGSSTRCASCAPVPTFSIRPPATSSAAAVSAAPCTSGMPRGRPSASERSSPATAADGRTGGRSGSSRAHPSASRSHSSVADASLGSVAAGAPSARRSQSLGCSAQRARRRASGSCSASHARIGPANPGAGGLPRAGQRRGLGHGARRRARGSPAAPARPPRRRARRRASAPRGRSPRPRARPPAPRRHAPRSATPLASPPPSPAAGVSTGQGARPVASTAPSSPTRSAFTAEVPRSSPRRMRDTMTDVPSASHTSHWGAYTAQVRRRTARRRRSAPGRPAALAPAREHRLRQRAGPRRAPRDPPRLARGRPGRRTAAAAPTTWVERRLGRGARPRRRQSCGASSTSTATRRSTPAPTAGRAPGASTTRRASCAASTGCSAARPRASAPTATTPPTSRCATSSAAPTRCGAARRRGRSSRARPTCSSRSAACPVEERRVIPGGVTRHTVAEHLADGSAARHGDRRRLSPIADDVQPELAPGVAPPSGPATDIAVMLALCHVLVAEDLHDRAFLDRYCAGADRFLAYVAGEADGVQDAGVGRGDLRRPGATRSATLARRMAAGRTMVTTTWSLQRAEHGEQPVWASIALAALLGQIGLPGGGFGNGYGSMADIGAEMTARARPGARRRTIDPTRLVDPRRAGRRHAAAAPASPTTSTASGARTRTRGSCTGPAATRSTTTRTSTGCAGRFARPDTILVHEPYWTAMARHADVVLPATTTLERDDIAAGRNDALGRSPCTAPSSRRGEARSDHAIFAALADRLGARRGLHGGPRRARLARATCTSGSPHACAGTAPSRPSFDAFWARGSARAAAAATATRCSSRTSAPTRRAHPLRTPSGRIELHSETVAGFGYDDAPGHAAWLEPERVARRHRGRRDVPAPPHREQPGAAPAQPARPRRRTARRARSRAASRSACTRTTPPRAGSPTATSCASSTTAARASPARCSTTRCSPASPSSRPAPGTTRSTRRPSAPLCVHGNVNVLTPDAARPGSRRAAPASTCSWRSPATRARCRPIRAYEAPRA